MTNAHPAEQKIRRALPVVRLMTAYFPIKATRALSNLSVGRAWIAGGVTTERVTVAGRPAEWFHPAGASDSSPVILYLHGGGFVFPASSLHRSSCSVVTAKSGARLLLIDYRLAPEHPFPAGLEDCIAAYKALLADGVEPSRLIVAGDSAGANLTLALLQALKRAGDPLPAAAVALSPVTDFTTERIGNPYKDTDDMLHPRAVRMFRTAYLPTQDRSDPLASPLFGDLSGLPPTLIMAGEREMLCSDAVAYAERAQAAGSPVTLRIEPRLWHVWPAFYPELPQAVDAMAQIAGFIREHTHG